MKTTNKTKTTRMFLILLVSLFFINLTLALDICNHGTQNNPSTIPCFKKTDESISWHLQPDGIRDWVYNNHPELFTGKSRTEHTAMRDDAQTAQKICELAGFATVYYSDCRLYSRTSRPPTGRCGWHHAHKDAQLAKWHESLNKFYVYSTYKSNPWLSSLTCIDPIACFDDSDCDDSNPKTENTCINLGTKDSYCQTKEIKCFNDAECGTDDYVGEKFCKNNNVYRKFQEFTCNKPGTGDSSCSKNIFDKLIKSCSSNEICTNGQCQLKDQNPPKIELLKPEKAQKVLSPVEFSYNVTDESELEYCKLFIDSNQVLKDTSAKTGINFFNYILTPDNYFWFIACVDEYGNVGQSPTQNFQVIEAVCKKDSDCGTDGFIPNTEVCMGDNVYAQYKTYTCKNPNTAYSECTSSVTLKLKEICEDGCENAQCIDKPVEPICTKDSDCGTNGFIPNTEVCMGDNVYAQYKTYTCINPNTSNSICSFSVSLKLKETCEEGCENAQCIDKPVEPVCTKDSDCGTNGFIPDTEICKQGNVYAQYKTYDCKNPNTKDSYCTSSTSLKLKQNCEYDCEDGKCLDKPCEPECSNNLDCPGFTTQELVCDGNDILRKITKPVCINEICSFNTSYEYVWTCSAGCIDGTCRTASSKKINECTTCDQEILTIQSTTTQTPSYLNYENNNPSTNETTTKTQETAYNRYLIYLLIFLIIAIFLVVSLIIVNLTN